jgi:hypothetical protein
MVLAEITRFLSAHGIRHGVAGAVAVHALGISRATQDLDLVVDEAGRAALLAHLSSLGYELLRASEGFSNHLHPDRRWGRLDFIYLDSHTADLLFGRAEPRDIYPGARALVPHPEHLIAMKVQAIKNDPARTFRDLADVKLLMVLPGVDRAEVRRYFDRHGLGREFEWLQSTMGPS